jgi:hypothetical protein
MNPRLIYYASEGSTGNKFCGNNYTAICDLLLAPKGGLNGDEAKEMCGMRDRGSIDIIVQMQKP